MALKPLARVVAEWKASGALPESCRLFVGDAVRPLAGEGRRARKGADAHVLEIVGSLVRIHAIAEVKSGHVAAERLHAQLIAPGNLP